MHRPPHDSYTYLQEQLNVWKTEPHVPSVNTTIIRNFLTTAQETLLPELRRLSAILEGGGLNCEVFPADESDLSVGIRVNTFHAVLRLSPADNPACVRAVIAGGSRPRDDLEWFIPYHQIQRGRLGRELQAAMLKLLRSSQAA
jgi:hypothetical protein